ncbi:MAG: S9 family peptidase [Flavobacteriales bacterium]|nr:S9 family peptidase [Flavobacteriales bacterium]
MMRYIYLIWITLFSVMVHGQSKKPITTAAYHEWKTIGDEKISDKGNWVIYSEKGYRSNDKLVLLEKGEPFKSWDRVKTFHLDPAERFVVFQQTLDYDSIRELKIKKVKKKKWPADSLGIFLVVTDSTFWLKKVEKFNCGEEGELVLITHTEDFTLPKPEEKKKGKCILFKHKKPAKLEDDLKPEGVVLSIYNIADKGFKQIENVLESQINRNGNRYAYVQSSVLDTITMSTLFVGTLEEESEVFALDGEISNLTFSEDGSSLAFNVSVDTSKQKKQQLYFYSKEKGTIKLLDTVSDHLEKYRTVSDKAMEFSEDGKMLFFQVGIRPTNDEKDTIPEDELARLDVWSWTDGRIQPQQLKSLKKDALGLIDYVYHIEEDKIIKLQDSCLQELKYYQNRNGRYALLTDQIPYLKEMTWDYWYYDAYEVDLMTGEKSLLAKHLYGNDYSLSPSGRYFTYWNPDDSSWYSKDIALGEEFSLTKNIPDAFYRRNHDVPGKVEASGHIHWLTDENACAIEGQNEFWIVPLGGKAYKFTKGEEKNESYELLRFDEKEYYVDLIRGFYLKSFNHKTKSEGIYYYGENGLEKLGEWDAKLMTLIQSKDKSKVVMEKMSFTESYNLFLGDGKFGKLKQITDVNPQQDEYKWGTVELFHWKDYEGDSVSGLLYKPEDFDPAKSYPMIVYYYELYTDNLHFYYRPKPTASIIYPTEYISSDYVVFIPDITYQTGYPAKGAYNSIMSGTDAVLKTYPNIDSTRMGLQGQSWGGYQTAQMITMTTRYKCAMAGAPVSNMFSAYGGVRWGTGLSRTFQYETGQSRIGATIWEKPELYTENSPLFHLPNVQAPLLIMHNDGDGAVPWYQGIELYMGLRRLQKPVWMLNYNDDEHNLMKDANRMDLSIRMKEFFDHYLQDKPEPDWMKDGVPAVKKGKE